MSKLKQIFEKAWKNSSDLSKRGEKMLRQFNKQFTNATANVSSELIGGLVSAVPIVKHFNKPIKSAIKFGVQTSGNLQGKVMIPIARGLAQLSLYPGAISLEAAKSYYAWNAGLYKSGFDWAKTGLKQGFSNELYELKPQRQPKRKGKSGNSRDQGTENNDSTQTQPKPKPKPSLPVVSKSFNQEKKRK